MNLFTLLFSFKGRLNRQGFWIGFGLNFLFLFIFANFLLDLTALNWLAILPLGLSLFSLSAVIIKRLHDRNRSASALLMVVVPIICYVFSLSTQGIMQFLLGVLMPALIGTILLMEWGIFQSYPEANAYGEKGLSLKWK